MEKQKISPSQLLAMIVLFEFGTALVVPIGLQAERGTWLSVLLALPGGLLLFWVYDTLSRHYPELILSGYIRKLLGRYLGVPLCVLYAAFFIYLASRVLRDGGDLLVTSSYDQTPILMIQAIMMIAVVYVLRKGVEVFFRLGQIYIFIMISLGLIGNMSILFSGIVDIRNLLPLFEDWPSLIAAAYPDILLFPFGELVVFTTVLPRLERSVRTRRTGLVAVAVSGVALSLSHGMQIAVLGEDVYARATFPLFEAISLVNIAEFWQRLDALVVLTLIIGVFFKVSMFMYAAMAVAADLFRERDPSRLTLPIGSVVLLMSIFMAWSFPEHLREGETTIHTHLVFFCLLVPLLLLGVHAARARRNTVGK